MCSILMGLGACLSLTKKIIMHSIVYVLSKYISNFIYICYWVFFFKHLRPYFPIRNFTDAGSNIFLNAPPMRIPTLIYWTHLYIHIYSDTLYNIYTYICKCMYRYPIFDTCYIVQTKLISSETCECLPDVITVTSVEESPWFAWWNVG